MIVTKETEPKQTFYFVYCPDGCSLHDASTKPIRHATHEIAMERACLAAQSNPGKPVYVLAAIDRVCNEIHDCFTVAELV
jgi:hypothetical protein